MNDRRDHVQSRIIGPPKPEPEQLTAEIKIGNDADAKRNQNMQTELREALSEVLAMVGWHHIPSGTLQRAREALGRPVATSTLDARGPEPRTQIEIVNDEWTCLCGNDAPNDGFYPVSAATGAMIEGGDQPKDWDGVTMQCGHCGRLIRHPDGVVVGSTKGERPPLPTYYVRCLASNSWLTTDTHTFATSEMFAVMGNCEVGRYTQEELRGAGFGETIRNDGPYERICAQIPLHKWVKGYCYGKARTFSQIADYLKTKFPFVLHASEVGGIINSRIKEGDLEAVSNGFLASFNKPTKKETKQ